MLLRRVTVASATLALTALAVACGRDVTPEPTNGTSGNLSGKMVITFRTNGTMDFNNVQYQVVINTCGTGEPYPNPSTTSYQNYSYIFAVGQGAGGAGVLPQLFQIALVQGSSSQLTTLPVPPNGSLESLQLNYNGQPNQFQLIFTRAQLANPLGVAQPCPGQIQPTSSPSAAASSSANPSPSAGTSPVASPSSSATATSTPTASPTPTPTGATGVAPSAFPTTFAQRFWYINFFTVQNNIVQDSLGTGGPTDTTYSLGIDTTSTNQNAVFKATGAAPPPSNSAASLAGGEVDNYL